MKKLNDLSQTEKHQVNSLHDRLDGCSMGGIQLQIDEQDGREILQLVSQYMPTGYHSRTYLSNELTISSWTVTSELQQQVQDVQHEIWMHVDTISSGEITMDSNLVHQVVVQHSLMEKLLEIQRQMHEIMQHLHTMVVNLDL